MKCLVKYALTKTFNSESNFCLCSWSLRKSVIIDLDLAVDKGLTATCIDLTLCSEILMEDVQEDCSL